MTKAKKAAKKPTKKPPPKLKVPPQSALAKIRDLIEEAIADAKGDLKIVLVALRGFLF